MRLLVPPRDTIDVDTPVRLNVAAVLAFPERSMTASGLRRETARGRLMVERVVANGSRVCVLDVIGQIGASRRARTQLVGFGQLPLSIVDVADFEPGGLQRLFVDFAPSNAPRPGSHLSRGLGGARARQLLGFIGELRQKRS